MIINWILSKFSKDTKENIILGLAAGLAFGLAAWLAAWLARS